MSAAPVKPMDTDRLFLPDVTLVAVSSVAIVETVRAMHESLARVRFGAALLLSHVDRPEGLSAEIECRRIERVASRRDYSAFMLRELHRHVGTSHMLCVQWDGYVLDASAWDQAFLACDYIDAPWPQFDDAMTVGNGGFSLRSTRLMAVCADLADDTDEAEDLAICRSLRPRMELDHGIRFAPEAVARRFAFERHRRRGDEFGFHGVFNLAELSGPRRLSQILVSL